jgi:hypothetical protein
MSKIRIPSKVLPGFKIISELSEDKIDKLISILENIEIGIHFEILDLKLQDLFTTEDSKALVFTFISFSNLLENEVDFYRLASNLSSSYYNITGIEKEPDNKLEINLKKIFTKSHNLLITVKARDLALENENTLTGIKVISDIRPVFNFDLESQNRTALILHKMHFTFQKGSSNRDIFLTMDAEDLKIVSKSIERAIKKDEILRKDYKLNFKFAN